MKKRMIIFFLFLLGITLAASAILDVHNNPFSFANMYAFYALYGFLLCVLMIVVATLIGMFIKRDDSYYDG
jgi:MFS family permease